MKSEYAVTGIKLLHFLVSVLLFYIFWILFRYGRMYLIGPGVDGSREIWMVDGSGLMKVAGKAGRTIAYGFRYNFFVTFGYGILLFFFNRTYNSYLLGYSRIRDCVFAEFLSQLFSIVLLYFGVSIAWNKWHNPVIFLALLFCQGLLDVVWSYYANGYFFRLYPTKRTLLIYRNRLDKKRFGTLHGKPSERLYRIVDEIMFDGTYDEIREKLSGYDAVFVAGVNSRCRNGILKYCKEENIPGFFLPHVGDVLMQEAFHIQSFDSPVLYVKRTALKPEYRIIKRTFDLLVSMLGIAALSPVLALTALIIRLYDHGPVLYKQVRLTKDGREFRIWKFRSMKVDAEKDGVARLSTGDDDDRITPVGRVIRKCRLDELPQLFNIAHGDMSFVGPRPERPEIAEQYYKSIPDFRLRLQVKAGLTGYAQVYGKYNTDPYEKVQFDILYINHMSVLTDLKLMFATVAILFRKDSTAGVAGGTTALHSEDD